MVSLWFQKSLCLLKICIMRQICDVIGGNERDVAWLDHHSSLESHVIGREHWYTKHIHYACHIFLCVTLWQSPQDEVFCRSERQCKCNKAFSVREIYYVVHEYSTRFRPKHAYLLIYIKLTFIKIKKFIIVIMTYSICCFRYVLLLLVVVVVVVMVHTRGGCRNTQTRT